MAIVPNDQYPGKTAGVSPEYPLGKARNVTTPGDGTGTPWEQAIVNDDLGFKQALLAEAGISASGTPDTALESQYLNALKSLFVGSDKISGTVGASGSITIPIFGTTPVTIKWGSVDYAFNPGEISVPVVFPTEFPNNCAVVMATRKVSDHSANGDGGALVYAQSKTGFSASLQVFNTSVSSLRGFSWLAIGW